MAAADQLTALMNLIGNVQGKSQTTKTGGGTQTTQTNVSDKGVQEILNQILSGSGGVKSIGTAARKSGLYNSTTEEQLLGELYSSAANKAELARTPTVTTTSPTTTVQKAEGTGVAPLLGTLGGAFLASQAINIGSKVLSPLVESGANSIGDALSSVLGIGSPSSGTGNTVGTGKNIFDNVDITNSGGFGGGFGGGDTSISTGEGYGLNTSNLGTFGSSSDVPGAKGINFGFNTDTGGTSASVGGMGALGGLIGSVLSGLSGGSFGSGGGGSGSSGGSVICTALKDRGLLDRELHRAGEAYLSKLPVEVKVGYHYWACSIAAKIKAGHEGWTKVCLPVARSRTALLATAGSFTDHVRYPLGTITKFLGEPVCGLLGKLVLSKEIFKNLQGV